MEPSNCLLNVLNYFTGSNLSKRSFWCLVYVLSVNFFVLQRKLANSKKFLLLKATWQAMKNLKMFSIEWDIED